MLKLDPTDAYEETNEYEEQYYKDIEERAERLKKEAYEEN